MFRLCGRSRPDLTMDGCMLTQRYQMQGFRELRKIRRLFFSFSFLIFPLLLLMVLCITNSDGFP